jgi:hypothetical protein
LEERLGSRKGVRHYIRVLQKLAVHSAELVAQAIEQCLAEQLPDASVIERRVEKLAAAGARPSALAANQSSALPDMPESVCQVTVLRTGLSHFDQHLSQGGSQDV